MNGNLWAVSKYNELISLIKQSQGKFFILGITLSDSSKNIKIKIRKFIKSKSTIYSNMLFIYYEISSDEETKTINKLFSSEKFSISNNEYPLMFHICNYNNVIINIKNVTDEIMNKAFDAMKKHYDEDKERWLKYQESLRKKESEKNKVNENEVNEKEINEKEINEKEINEKEINEKEINEKEINEKEINEKEINGKEVDKKEEKTQEEIKEEKKRTIDKLICLKNKSNEYQLNFMSDIQKRKEEEEIEKKTLEEAEKEKIKKIMKEKKSEKDKKK